MLDMIFIQGIGAIAFCALSLSYFKKEKKQILFIQIIAYIFFTIHFYLLNGITGAICNFIGLITLITIYIFDKYKLKNKILVSIFFILILLVVNIIEFQNLYSIFPLIALTIVIISFIKNNEDDIRLIGVVSAICWLIYAIVYKSYVSIVFESVTLISIFSAFVKNELNKKVDFVKGKKEK